MGKFEAIGRALSDKRAANAQHELWEILFVALAAVLCGAKSCCDMALFGRSKQALLRQFLRLEHGIPSHDTFSRVFRQIDPQAFEAAFRKFMAAFAKANGIKLTGVVAVDGKALRGAYERGKASTPLQMVNVFATEARLALAARKAPGRNEAEGALEVLRMLSLEGCIVTADALHCHRRFAAAVRARGADYALALKKNQAKLHAAVVRRFCPRRPAQHGASARGLHARPHRNAAGDGCSRCRLRGGQQLPGRRRSRPHHVAPAPARPARREAGRALLSVVQYIPAKRLLATVRSHWGIENRLHWVLDVVLSEDANRSRKDNAPENLAILRRLALNIVRCHPDRISLRQKIKRAGWDDAFLRDMLTHMR